MLTKPVKLFMLFLPRERILKCSGKKEIRVYCTYNLWNCGQSVHYISSQVRPLKLQAMAEVYCADTKFERNATFFPSSNLSLGFSLFVFLFSKIHVVPKKANLLIHDSLSLLWLYISYSFIFTYSVHSGWLFSQCNYWTVTAS